MFCAELKTFDLNSGTETTTNTALAAGLWKRSNLCVENGEELNTQNTTLDLGN